MNDTYSNIKLPEQWSVLKGNIEEKRFYLQLKHSFLTEWPPPLTYKPRDYRSFSTIEHILRYQQASSTNFNLDIALHDYFCNYFQNMFKFQYLITQCFLVYNSLVGEKIKIPTYI